MRKSLLALLCLFLWMSWPVPGAAQQASPTPRAAPPAAGTSQPDPSLTPVPPGISLPLNNSLLSGVVTISGFAPGAWELAFAYRDDPTDTWFLLAASSEAPTAEALFDWDTSLITDGFYVLRLRAYSADALQDDLVNVQIRNYSPTETPTLAGTPTFTPTASLTPLPTFTPTITYTPASQPTALPTNPAVLQPSEITLYFGKGALIVMAVFASLGLLLSLSRKLRL